MVGAVDERLAVIGLHPGQGNQRQPGRKRLPGSRRLRAWKASMDNVCLMVLSISSTSPCFPKFIPVRN